MLIRTQDDLVLWQRRWADYHVLLAMVQLGLFTLLADGQSRSAECLATALKADARAMDICGRILTNAGLLVYEEGKFSLADTARTLSIPVGDLTWEWRRRENYANLLETVKTGRPAMSTSGGLVEDNEADARQFLTMQYRSSAANVQEAVKLLQHLQAQRPGQQRWRILDLGGGHGRYAATFENELPHTEATLFDRPLATRLAQEIAGARFSIRSGDFLHDDLGGLYEIVFMAHIVSGIAHEDITTLFQRLRAVIVPNGFLVIEDIFVDPEHNLQPNFAIDFQLRMLLENERGRFRTIPEVCGLLAEAGFPSQQRHPVEGKDFSFIVASEASPIELH